MIFNMISVLPIEYDTVTKVTKEKDNELAEELSKHKPLCYYVMKGDFIEEDKAIFERHDMSI